MVIENLVTLKKAMSSWTMEGTEKLKLCMCERQTARDTNRDRKRQRE